MRIFLFISLCALVLGYIRMENGLENGTGIHNSYIYDISTEGRNRWNQWWFFVNIQSGRIGRKENITIILQKIEKISRQSDIKRYIFIFHVHSSESFETFKWTMTQVWCSYLNCFQSEVCSRNNRSISLIIDMDFWEARQHKNTVRMSINLLLKIFNSVSRYSWTLFFYYTGELIFV